VNDDEINHMFKVSWTTMLSLYDRLKLKEKLKLVALEEDWTLSPGADIMAITLGIEYLIRAVKDVLRKFQRTLIEKDEICTYKIVGRINTLQLMKFYPIAIPCKRVILSEKNIPNLFVVATLIQIRNTLLKEVRRLKRHGELKPISEILISKLSEVIHVCDLMLSDPLLKPLLREAEVISRSKEKIYVLENELINEIQKKPRELKPYRILLDEKRRLLEGVHLLTNNVNTLNSLANKYGINIIGWKLYEIYCFTLLLEQLLNLLTESGKSVECDLFDEKILFIKSDNLEITISYNALIENVKDRIKTARAYGILDSEISELLERLGCLPDTLIRVRKSTHEKLIVIDYKWTRDISYITTARFKGLAYLYELNANFSAIITPPPSFSEEYLKSKEIDEEIQKNKPFYHKILMHGGVIIWLDGNERDRILALAYIDPKEESLQKNKKVMNRLARLILE